MEEQNLASSIMSDIITHMKYARYLPSEHRRETYAEIIDRNKAMHIKKFPLLKDEIDEAYKLVYEKKILPSMRSLQFAGRAVEVNNLRLYNCSYTPINNIKAFSELAFLLLAGTGVGLSVQKHHVKGLPVVLGAQEPIGKQHKKRFLVSDDIEGWADAIKVLVESHFFGERQIAFDFRAIREKGAYLKTSGGRAPGPAPLEACLVKIDSVFCNAVITRGRGTKLKPIEVYDICCFIADMVLAGGIRRAALLTLFSLDDTEMLESKYGTWWESNPQRGRSNNSALVLRSQITREVFDSLWKKIEASGAGEPGIVFSDSADYGVNPCFTGDTQLLTTEGYQTFDSLSGSEVEIIDEYGSAVLGKVWCSGNKATVKLNLSDNSFITCTPDHKFYIPMESAWVEAKDTVGKRLNVDMSFNYSRDNVYERYGFIQGDGNLTRLNSPEHPGMEINIGMNDDDILELFGVCRTHDERTFYMRGFNEALRDAGFCAAVLPERLFPLDFYNSIEDKASFLRGLYSANGSVIKGHRVAFKTTCKALADTLLFVLERDFKIQGYITTNKAKKVTFANGDYTCKESYDVNISAFTGVLSFFKSIGFLQQYKMTDLVALVACKAPKVLRISENGTHDVYDFTVSSTHSGWVKGTGNTGVLAHNCCEISLPANNLCNLTEINSSNLESQEDFNYRARMASRIGTLQAAYTDFHYLREEWQDTVEKEALIGVSLTGIASGVVTSLDMSQGAKEVVEENIRMAKALGINPAARTTCVKPSGTASLLLGTSSGIHAWYAPYYWRRVSVGKEEPIYTYLANSHPELIEDDYFKPSTMAKIKIPMKAPDNAALRYETAIDTLTRLKKVQTTWIADGHIEGINKNNVSCTISVRDSEWEEVGDWMWENRNIYTGIAVLPYDGGSYTQSPFEECTKEDYEEAMQYLTAIDLTAVFESVDGTSLQSEAACGGGACEIK